MGRFPFVIPFATTRCYVAVIKNRVDTLSEQFRQRMLPYIGQAIVSPGVMDLLRQEAEAFVGRLPRGARIVAVEATPDNRINMQISMPFTPNQDYVL